MADRVYIYVLLDPRDDTPRYVGKSHNPWRRLFGHAYEARKKPHTHRARWLTLLKRLGLKPLLLILEATTPVKCDERERFWIRFLIEEGCDLVNATEGGDGGPIVKGRKFTESHRQAISRALKGHALSEKARQTLLTKGFQKGHKTHNRIEMDDDTLRLLYVDERLSLQEVADRMNISVYAISRRAREPGIVRPNAEAVRMRNLKRTRKETR